MNKQPHYPKGGYVDYCPDGWVIIKFPKDDYRVFGGWFGGYLDSDHYRINSGCVKTALDDKGWIVHGDSGSIYFVGTENYDKLPSYCASVAGQYCQKNGGVLLTEEEAFDYLNGLLIKE
jgi:hypothetical protein